eukprot:3911812-Pleurochrysis_carterae.AAC.1
MSDAAAAAAEQNAAAKAYVPTWRPGGGFRLHYRSTKCTGGRRARRTTGAFLMTRQSHGKGSHGRM